MDYRIALSTPDIISIVFEGCIKGVQSSSRNNFAVGLTFDVNTLRMFTLSDFVALDEALARKLLDSKKVFRSDWPDTEENRNTLRSEFLSRPKCRDINSLINYLRTFDFESNYYVTPTTLCIKFPISSAGGDYVWVEVPLEG